MTSSVHALLGGIVDYAGLFPPAQLPLDQAVRHHAHYRREADAWMLGRFILPAARLAELTAFQEELSRPGPPFTISALGRGGDTPADFLAGLRDDRNAITAFAGRYGPSAVVDAFEVRIAPAVAQEAAEVLPAVLDALTGPDLAPASVAFELPLDAAWRTAIPAFVGVLRAVNRALGKGRRPAAGFKLRTGGLEASAFPSPEQVAFVIATCRDAGVSLKCTAGLHHPLRRFDPGVGTHMHGFVNVFGAGVLAHARGLGTDRLRSILEEEAAGHFAFAPDSFRWQDLRATVPEIETARREAVTSFGSCSFDEPRADLRELGWLK